MRPVVRGECPKNRAGNDVRFSEYAKARRDMIARLGEYCSYCEMHLDSSLAIEHVKPKQPPGASAPLPERELAWDNFLLSCTNCNSTKDNTDVVLDDYLWPDQDNTFRALSYHEGGIVKSVPGDWQDRADNIIKLVGLNKMLDTAEASDRRWLNRKEAWDMATRAKERLARNDYEDMREQILDTVTEKGYWSIWMTVFADDADMRRRFIEAMPGTCNDCFDPAQGYVPVPRPGGAC